MDRMLKKTQTQTIDGDHTAWESFPIATWGSAFKMFDFLYIV